MRYLVCAMLALMLAAGAHSMSADDARTMCEDHGYVTPDIKPQQQPSDADHAVYSWTTAKGAAITCTINLRDGDIA